MSRSKSDLWIVYRTAGGRWRIERESAAPMDVKPACRTGNIAEAIVIRSQREKEDARERHVRDLASAAIAGPRHQSCVTIAPLTAQIAPRKRDRVDPHLSGRPGPQEAPAGNVAIQPAPISEVDQAVHPILRDPSGHARQVWIGIAAGAAIGIGIFVALMIGR